MESSYESSTQNQTEALMNQNDPVTILARWDDEAKVWYVAESSYPGLHTEGKTLDRFLKRAKEALELLREVNGETVHSRITLHAEAA
jgi:predicted RNase H-like HicB family nuclease